jgi:hypothetical protein
MRKQLKRECLRENIMDRVNYFYDLPIYRLSSERFDQDWDKFLQKRLYMWRDKPKEQIDEFYKRNPDLKIRFTQDARKMFGGPWRYNEIIGYIRLHFLGDQIRGEYWLVKAKKIVKTRKKIIDYCDHKIVPEKTIPRDATNSEILEIVMAYIGKAKKYLKKRYVDSEDFEKIGKYVDWKSLMKLQ